MADMIKQLAKASFLGVLCAAVWLALDWAFFEVETRSLYIAVACAYAGGWYGASTRLV